MILLTNGQVAEVVTSSASYVLVRTMRPCGIWSDTYWVRRSAR